MVLSINPVSRFQTYFNCLNLLMRDCLSVNVCKISIFDSKLTSRWYWLWNQCLGFKNQTKRLTSQRICQKNFRLPPDYNYGWRPKSHLAPLQLLAALWIKWAVGPTQFTWQFNVVLSVFSGVLCSLSCIGAHVECIDCSGQKQRSCIPLPSLDSPQGMSLKDLQWIWHDLLRTYYK